MRHFTRIACRIFGDRRFLLAPACVSLVTLVAALALWAVGSIVGPSPLGLDWVMNLWLALGGPALALWAAVYLVVTVAVVLDVALPADQWARGRGRD